MMKNYFYILILFTSIACNTKKQEVKTESEKEQISIGEVATLHSSILNEDRNLNIYLPHGYHPDSTRTYNTIYLLDGSKEEDFKHIAGLVQFMQLSTQMQPTIVVGVGNIDRNRDFTHPSKDSLDTKDFPTHGGSEKFIRFLKEEAQPYINKNYKTNKHSTLIGQSLGGLLATEILLKNPSMFNDYIIVSPSLWWNEYRMLKNIDSLLNNQQFSNPNVFLSVGKEHPAMNEIADSLAKKLDSKSDINCIYKPDYDEDHATILHPAVHEAFKTLYKKEH